MYVHNAVRGQSISGWFIGGIVTLLGVAFIDPLNKQAHKEPPEPKQESVTEKVYSYLPIVISSENNPSDSDLTALEGIEIEIEKGSSSEAGQEIK